MSAGDKPQADYSKLNELLAKHQQELEELGVADRDLYELEEKRMEIIFSKVPPKPTEE